MVLNAVRTSRLFGGCIRRLVHVAGPVGEHSPTSSIRAATDAVARQRPDDKQYGRCLTANETSLLVGVDLSTTCRGSPATRR